MKNFKIILLLLLAGYASSAWSLDDLLLYSDVGCDKTGIEQSFAQVGGGTMRIAAEKKVPITCTDKHRGSDAVDLDLSADLAMGGYYDFVIKFPDWGQKSIGGHADVRFFVKNLLASEARLAVRWENSTYQSSTRRAVIVPANSGWAEVVVPLSDFGTFTKNSLMNGFAFSQPDVVIGSRSHLLIDDIRITDGTGQGNVEVPTSPGGSAPAGWSSNLITGSYDNYTDSLKAKLLMGKVDYRYQYLTTGWKDYNQGHYIGDFIKTSVKIGARSAFTWYHVAKAGEGGASVKSSLNNAAFMKAYFEDFESALEQIAAEAGEAPLLIIEPDMYGFLLQSDLIPNFDASLFSVDMTRANSLSGGAYASTLKGYCEYMVQRAKSKVPGLLAGHLINSWSTLIPGEIGQGSLDAHLLAAVSLSRFINSLGAKGKGDLVFVEKSDRDAGTKGSKWFWGDEQYQRYFAWVKTLSFRSGLRVCGWQVSAGTSQSPALNRDDAAERFRDHPAEWSNAGFIGVLFGPGAEGQADYANDGGFFLKAMESYQSRPQPISVTTSAQLRAQPRRIPALVGRRPWGLRDLPLLLGRKLKP